MSQTLEIDFSAGTTAPPEPQMTVVVDGRGPHDALFADMVFLGQVVQETMEIIPPTV